MAAAGRAEIPPNSTGQTPPLGAQQAERCDPHAAAFPILLREPQSPSRGHKSPSWDPPALAKEICSHSSFTKNGSALDVLSLLGKNSGFLALLLDTRTLYAGRA